jgi:hypothetical protein
MSQTPQVVSQMRSKKRVYVTATLVAMAILLPFQHDSWAPFVAASVGYTILVFGLRRLQLNPRPPFFALPPGSVLCAHTMFLLVAVLWVWLLIALMPRLPYILRTEDSSHPYFGLAFIGVLGLLLLEAVEQRSLRRAAADQAGDSPVPGPREM